MLLQQGSSPSEIAKQRELSLSTVYNHLAGAIEVGLITAMDVISLKEAEYKSIVAMIESFDTEEQGRLKPVYDAFEGWSMIMVLFVASKPHCRSRLKYRA